LCEYRNIGISYRERRNLPTFYRHRRPIAELLDQELLKLPKISHADGRNEGCLHSAAYGSIEHPLRQFKSSSRYLAIETAAEDTSIAVNDGFDDLDPTSVPGMPRIADVA
jgi:hypothetical protein